jgi:GTP pyrophosphokinase
MEKESVRFDVNLKQALENGSLPEVLKEYGFSKQDDLYAAIGYGKLSPRKVLARLVPPEKLQEKTGAGASLARAVRRVLKGSDDKIKVDGMDDLMVYRAKCCNWIPRGGSRSPGRERRTPSTTSPCR